MMKNSTEPKDNPQGIRGVFYFDPTDGIYNDHFPGRPVVPGSLIVHAFFEAIRKAGLGENCHLIEDFKFSRFVFPGEYNFDIQPSSKGLRCRLYKTSLDKTKTWVVGTIKPCIFSLEASAF
jgi:3-hydroxyacyl-[acyl-carrier-protein] dehydratase